MPQMRGAAFGLALLMRDGGEEVGDGEGDASFSQHLYTPG